MALLGLSRSFISILAISSGVFPPKVTTKDGGLIGTHVTTRGGREVCAFLGVPYAKPPLGDLRFQPPQPASPWTGPRLAVKKPPACSQTLTLRSSEDCLYLNVYTPQINPKSLLPVFVFIHGGQFERASAAGFTPEYLLDQDVILISVQYRLGLLGFLSTGDEVVPGNMGLKDVRLSLRWVKNNIRYFGGDPDKVTIGGQSSGASIVHFLMIFSAGEGLFRAAISESGTSLSTWAFHPPREVQRMKVVLAALSGCPVESSLFVDCLRKKSVEELLLLYSVLYKDLTYPGLRAEMSVPRIGGVIEPECVKDRLITGNPWHFNTTIPWLVGVTSKEALFFFTPHLIDKTNTLFSLFNRNFDTYFPLALNYQNSVEDGSNIAADVRSLYLNNQPISRNTLSQVTDIISDTLIIYGTFESIRRSNQYKTYTYLYEHVSRNDVFHIPSKYRIGPEHSNELWNFYPRPYNSRRKHLDSEEDVQLSKKMVKLWINFITYLNPTPVGTSDVKWAPFYPNNSYLHIQENGLMKMEQMFLKDRMEFWQSHSFPYKNDYYKPIPCIWTQLP